jgi:hypothetical protein
VETPAGQHARNDEAIAAVLAGRDRRAAAGDDQAQDAQHEQDTATGWTVTTFDGQRKVGEGTFDSEQLARHTARVHRDHGYTTRVRPAGILDGAECCDDCTDENWSGRGFTRRNGETS